jgi:hypothetical protein
LVSAFGQTQPAFLEGPVSLEMFFVAKPSDGTRRYFFGNFPEPVFAIRSHRMRPGIGLHFLAPRKIFRTAAARLAHARIGSCRTGQRRDSRRTGGPS